MAPVRTLGVSRAALLPAALLVAFGACLSVSARRGGPGRTTTQGAVPQARLPRTGDEPQTSDRHGRPSAAMAKRRVASKEPPATLLASDGLRCTVSHDRYEKVRVGDDVLCLWTDRSDDPTPPDTP